MATNRKSNTRGNSIRVDFTGVEAGGGGRLLPEGVYQFEVIDIERKVGESSKEPYLAFELAVADDGEFKGTKCWDNFSLQPQSLWKLRGFLDAAGQETVDGPMDLDLDELVGLVVEAEVFHETYKGKDKHRIGSYLVSDGATDDGARETAAAHTTRPAADEAPAAPARRRRAAADEDADDGSPRVGMKVSFKDGRKVLKGTISEINGDVIAVKVGQDEFEMGLEDLTIES